MTKAQVCLLRAVIEAEIAHVAARAHNEFPLPRRDTEVGKIAGIDPRTARSLVNAGLLEYAGSDNPHQTWVQFAKG